MWTIIVTVISLNANAPAATVTTVGAFSSKTECVAAADTYKSAIRDWLNNSGYGTKTVCVKSRG